jgi:hypothetical protein
MATSDGHAIYNEGKKIEIDVLMPDHVVYIYALYMHGN